MADDNGSAAGIDALRRLLDDKIDQIKHFSGKLRDQHKLIRGLTAERDAALAARDEAAAAAAKAAKDYDTSGLKGEVEALRAGLRERDHRAVFDREAAARGATPETVELLYRLSGYRPESDAPDAAAIGERLEAMKLEPGTGRLFGEPGPGPAAAPPPGSGQGRRDLTPGKMRVTTDQMRDGAWCMANADRLREARKKGQFEIIPS